MARRVPGRPAAIGEVTSGKRTASRSGITGRVVRSVMYASCGESHHSVLKMMPRATRVKPLNAGTNLNLSTSLSYSRK